MKDGFLKIACVTPPLRVADCAYNAEQIIAHAREAAAAGAKLAAFPELCLTGYTCGDLFLQEPLLRGAEDGLVQILQETADLSMLLVIGHRRRHRDALCLRRCPVQLCRSLLCRKDTGYGAQAESAQLQ